LAQVKPRILDKINEDEYAEYVWQIHGAPTKLLNSDEQVRSIREQIAEAARAEEEKEAAGMLMAGADTVANLEKTGAGSIQ